jgi:iron complex outermembrane receptor protein
VTKTFFAALSGVSILAMTAAPAFAQAQDQEQSPPADDESEPADDREIVVTGTLIRGIAPVGATVVSVSREQIETSGATDTNQLLATLPQTSSFMNLPGLDVRGTAGIGRVPVNRPNLRFIPGADTSSGSTTLVLLDGKRIVPIGFEQAVVDVGVIPSGIISRVETILDGASAIYGSDAVGGVINFITTRRFGETKADIQYSMTNGYQAVSADITSGLKWDGGGLAVTYSFGCSIGRKNTPSSATIWRGGRFTGLACDDYSHVTIGTGASQRRFINNVGETTFTEGVDWCPSNQHEALQAEQERHGVFAVISHDFTDALTFDLTGLYFDRRLHVIHGPFTSTATIGPNNPYFMAIPGAPAASHSVAFSYAPLLGVESQYTDVTSKVGQINPSLRYMLGSWQVRASGGYGWSESRTGQRTLDTGRQLALVGGTSFATALNPYNITDPRQNMALISNLFWTTERIAKFEFMQASVVADGPLMAIGGGDVKVAVGAEWNRTNFTRALSVTATRTLGPFASTSTESFSLFGEVVAPFVSSQNGRPGLEGLTLSLSGRYDHYKGSGGSFTPKVGLTYEPFEWLTLRGSWGKSFRAPNPVDKLGSSGNSLGCIGDVPNCTQNFFSQNVIVPAPLPAGQNVFLFLSGSDDNITAERSTSWSIAGDFRVPIKGDLVITAGYYNIDFRDRIALPPSNLPLAFGDAPFLFDFPAVGQTFSLQELNAYRSLASNAGTAIDNVINSGYNALWFYDGRSRNLSRSKLTGVDVTARYRSDTSFGSVDAMVSGNWLLSFENQLASTSPFTDFLRVNEPTFRMSAQVGAEVGIFRAQATLRHMSGFAVDPSATRDPNQRRIEAFRTLDLSLRMNVNGGDERPPAFVLTLNVTNVFDTRPPVNRTTAGSTINGRTMGRMMQLGLSKTF